ncbi:MAG: hypothetical protein OES47_12995, partial [Acidobacteriota bacterium]|nr:hypothetical protein [Acidobacteriota bacterium]
ILEEQYISPPFLGWVGRLFVEHDRRESAADVLATLRERVNEGNLSDQAALHLLQGEIELQEGRAEEAVDLFRLACQLRRDAISLDSLARGQLALGQLQEAATSYEESIALRDLGWEGQEYWLLAPLKLGKVFEELGDFERAAGSYRDFLRIWEAGDEDLVDLAEAERRLEALRAPRAGGGERGPR